MASVGHVVAVKSDGSELLSYPIIRTGVGFKLCDPARRGFAKGIRLGGYHDDGTWMNVDPPSISPDGTQFAVIETGPSEPNVVCLYRSDNLAPIQRIPVTDAVVVGWSPDMRFLQVTTLKAIHHPPESLCVIALGSGKVSMVSLEVGSSIWASKPGALFFNTSNRFGNPDRPGKWFKFDIAAGQSSRVSQAQVVQETILRLDPNGKNDVAGLLGVGSPDNWGPGSLMFSQYDYDDRKRSVTHDLVLGPKVVWIAHAASTDASEERVAWRGATQLLYFNAGSIFGEPDPRRFYYQLAIYDLTARKSQTYPVLWRNDVPGTWSLAGR